MKEKPINMTAEEVRAILDGRKTQFRRIIKPQPAEGLAWRGAISCSTVKADEGKHLFTDRYPCARQAQRIRCPFGNPRNGDRLRIKDPRTILAIESVRVERIRDITHHDALAEGCQPHPDCKHNTRGDDFQRLWESINGPGSWAENPWVWVVEFRRLEGAQ